MSPLSYFSAMKSTIFLKFSLTLKRTHTDTDNTLFFCSYFFASIAIHPLLSQIRFLSSVPFFLLPSTPGFLAEPAAAMAESAGCPGTPESSHSGDHAGGTGAREQDRFLPIANIGRIMRKGIPENGKIAKDAKESVQECVSEFISFITSEASDKCQREKRKTINGDDLLWAMGTLGFEEYVEPLKLYLQLYREVIFVPLLAKLKHKNVFFAVLIKGVTYICLLLPLLVYVTIAAEWNLLVL
ncbi:nuclear transcription factor Y subunit B-4 isoform X1 [Canna indica]|uniref:Nuclear transcription factor Y subunit B-4 isoform X1 n=1 Tax=Canna indica TaxID=4628 RepID=A0AAQ3K3Z3_9LILI|nr:nuclear transcription factor Y subunit B-4 isoform X1 [Canna indica]